MPRLHWADLPAEVRREVEAHTGRVRSADQVGTGSVCDVAAVLHTDGGRIFCKGIRTDSQFAWMYRNEARFNGWLPEGVVPRLLWTIETAGWLLLGFEHAPGRHPDLSPGSPDLDAVADVLAELSQALTPCPPIPVQPFTKRWADLIDPALVDGDMLLHTDVTPRNFLLGDRLRVVDWSMPCRGAAWIDTAFMLVRLIRAGHSPDQAERWARRVPAWTEAPPGAVTAFADTLAELWAEKHRTAPIQHRGPLAHAARRWAFWRADRSPLLAHR